MIGCTNHTAYIYDRGGKNPVGKLDGVTLVRWGRVRDDISEAQVVIGAPSGKCMTMLRDKVRALRHELVVFRGKDRVWEGPITLIAMGEKTATIEAKDVMFYAYRTACRAGRISNPVETVVQRAKGLLTTELARKEAMDPPYNVLPYVRAYHTSTDARTAKRTKPYETTVFDDIDSMASRTGLDYTVLGRSIILFDTHTIFAKTPTVTTDDFMGEVIVTEYGLNGATHAYATSSEGLVGMAADNAVDPYYGEWEVIDSAYNEEGTTAPTQSALNGQASRSLAGKMPPPLIVRVPENATLNPSGNLTMRHLVPGIRIPLRATLNAREVWQMQKLDQVTVTDSPQGEKIAVTMGAASRNDEDYEEQT